MVADMAHPARQGQVTESVTRSVVMIAIDDLVLWDLNGWPSGTWGFLGGCTGATAG